jgi:hypothetical protein
MSAKRDLFISTGAHLICIHVLLEILCYLAAERKGMVRGFAVLDHTTASRESVSEGARMMR